MKCSRTIKLLSLSGVLSTFLIFGQSLATEEWLFLSNAYPQDVLLYSYVMYGAIEQSNLSNLPQDETSPDKNRFNPVMGIARHP